MTAYFGIFKEPRGLIRLLQFIFAIFAFATACNGSSSMSFQINNNSTATAAWSYAYNLQNSQVSIQPINTQISLSASNDIQPSAQFFVFTGVTSMLLSLAFAVIYVLMDRQYRNDERIPIVDFVITLIWTIFWIAGSSAWAQGVTNIRSQTSFGYVSQLVPDCSSASACTQTTSGGYANIIVSVIFGFLNFFLWLSSVWFVYKETKFFKSRTAQQQQQPQPQQNNFSNLGVSGIHQPSSTQMPSSMG